MNAAYWIRHLELNEHPEGGFYKETYRSAEKMTGECLAGRFDDERNVSTAIYFLLRTHDRSVFHRIKSDELWHFYAGGSLSIYVLDNNGLSVHKLGCDLENGERPQIVIPANAWFGAQVNEPHEYVLAGCTVAPGFDFRDFEMAERESLLQQFPQHESIIRLLT